jgi:hypothetical protein
MYLVPPSAEGLSFRVPGPQNQVFLKGGYPFLAIYFTRNRFFKSIVENTGFLKKIVDFWPENEGCEKKCFLQKSPEMKQTHPNFSQSDGT